MKIIIDTGQDGKVINARVRQKTATLSQWLVKDPVILDGEQAFIIRDDGTPLNFRIGDGSKKFSELPDWIAYEQGTYVPVAGSALPTLGAEIRYTWVGPGTYTQSGGPDIVVPSGNMGVLSWDGSEWSLSQSVEMPDGVGDDVKYILQDALSNEEGLGRIISLDTTNWEQGGLLDSGQNTSSSPQTRVRSIEFIHGRRLDITADGCEFVIMFFNKDGVKIQEFTWVSSGTYENPYAETFRILVRKNNTNPNFPLVDFFDTNTIVKAYDWRDGPKKVATQEQLGDYTPISELISLVKTGELRYGIVEGKLAFNNMAKLDNGSESPASSGRDVWKLDFTDISESSFPITVHYKVSTSRGNGNNISVVLEEKDSIFTPLVRGLSGTINREQQGSVLVNHKCILWINSHRDFHTEVYYISENGEKQSLFTRVLKSAMVGSQGIFDKAYVISNPESGELCSHSSVLYTDSKRTGDIYLMYNPNKVSSTETIGNSQTSMTWFNVCNPRDITKIDIAVKGQEVGSFKHSSGGHSPYEPYKFDIDLDNFRIIYTAINENDSLGKRQVWQKFTKSTKTLEPLINQCYLKYNNTTVPFTNDNCREMFNSLFSSTITAGAWNAKIPQTITRFIQYNGWDYAWFSMGEAASTDGKVVAFLCRTQDGITYEYVARPDMLNASYNEGSIELIGDRMYIIVRGTSTYRITYYDLIANLWGPETTVSDTNGEIGRPFLKLYKGKLIAICNSVSNEYNFPEGRSWRSGVTIWEVNIDSLTTQKIAQFSNMYGCHYYTLREDMQGRWWFSYSEDRRQLSSFPNNNNRSNIGLVRFEDLVGF